MRRVLTVAIGVALGGAAQAQPAPPPAGERPVAEVVAEGQALAQAGKIAESLPLFREAAQREPTAAHQCLVALTWFRLGRLPEARLRLDRAVAAGDERPDWCADAMLGRDIDRALAAGAYGAVDLEVRPAGEAPPQVDIGALAPGEVAAVPGRVWLPWGNYRVAIRWPGQPDIFQDVAVSGKQPVPLVLTQEDRGTIARLVNDPGFVEPVIMDSPPHGWRHRHHTGGWIVLGVGVAALGGGVGFHLAAASSRSNAMDLYAGPAFDAERDRFESRRTLALGFYVGGAVISAVGAWLVSR
jgi:hypothetical protein